MTSTQESKKSPLVGKLTWMNPGFNKYTFNVSAANNDADRFQKLVHLAMEVETQYKMEYPPISLKEYKGNEYIQIVVKLNRKQRTSTSLDKYELYELDLAIRKHNKKKICSIITNGIRVREDDVEDVDSDSDEEIEHYEF